jgi:hypothetical protein
LRALFRGTQLGITHDVDEKNVGDFQPEFRFLFLAHRGMNLCSSAEALYIIFTEGGHRLPNFSRMILQSPQTTLSPCAADH